MQNINGASQSTLSAQQLQAFYHDVFVEDQVRHFMRLIGGGSLSVSDVGGGCGHFARRLQQRADAKVRVIDSDESSIDACREAGVEAMLGNALDANCAVDSDVVSFNLILHHLVGRNEEVTAGLQRRALTVWKSHVRSVFVNEYIYESYLGDLSGWLIFQITRSRLLSAVGSLVARVIPSLKANTFGVGVRFRAHDEWRRLFERAGYDVRSVVVGDSEPISWPRRVLLIKDIRRDSFLLQLRVEQAC